MVIWLALLFPVLTIIIMYVVPQFRGKIALWEPLVILGVSIILIFTVKIIAESATTSDTERIIDYVVKVEHHEYWNEWIHKTCENCTTDKDGSENCTTYDCSYEEEYDPYTKIYTSTGETYIIDEGYRVGGIFSSNSGNIEKFKYFTKLFGKPVNTVKEHLNELNVNHGENYDGDIHTILYSHNIDKLEYVTWEHSYENRVQESNSIQKFDPVDTSDIKFYGLFEYPKIYNNYKSNCILGYNNKYLDDYANKLNSLIASKKQLKTYFLVFKNKTRKAAMMQERHWGGGNKNEAVICIGVDNNNKITWSNVFSWSTESKFKIEIRNHIESKKQLNDSTFKEIIEYSNNNLNANFKRREFKEFNYLTIEPSTGAIWTVFILVFLACVGLFIWSIRNEFDADKNNNSGYYNY